MDTAHKTDEEKKEYFDSEEVLDQKITMLAEWIKASKHFIAFTGAGISTSAGIPDYRSGVNTVLPTGPGAWEKAAKGVKGKSTVKKPMSSAIPTPCHMSLVKLHEVGYLKYLISQNVDGLHRKSGIPAKKIAEVHGNTNLEVCRNSKCKKKYLRDFRVRTAKTVHDHKTGRMCENCGKELHDSIINFGENLPEEELNNGFNESAKSDLCLVLGSSLRVTPAANMPEETSDKGGRLVIVNLQATPLDSKAFRINGLIDDVMSKLMKKLGLDIPPFTLKRRVMVTKTDVNVKNPTKKGQVGIEVRGIDEEGSHYSLFNAVETTFSASKETMTQTKEPMRFHPTKLDLNSGKLLLNLVFAGHYNEPSLKIEVPLEVLKLNSPIHFFMEFNPQTKKWSFLQNS